MARTQCSTAKSMNERLFVIEDWLRTASIVRLHTPSNTHNISPVCDAVPRTCCMRNHECRILSATQYERKKTGQTKRHHRTPLSAGIWLSEASLLILLKLRRALSPDHAPMILEQRMEESGCRCQNSCVYQDCGDSERSRIDGCTLPASAVFGP